MSAEKVKLLRDLAASARALASRISDRVAVDGLMRHACDLETRANELEGSMARPDAAIVSAAESTATPEIAAALKPAEPEGGSN